MKDLTKETEKQCINKKEGSVVLGNQMKRVFLGGSDQLCQIL